jgi:hypothetical protein
VRCFVRSKIVDPLGSISSGRLWAGGEPDILRRPQAYSRYRVLCIPPVLHRPFQRPVTMLVTLADRLNPASRRATLQRRSRTVLPSSADYSLGLTTPGST